MEWLERRQTMDATISGIVFNDTDANDVQNGGEVGIGGVTVELYNDVNSNGTFESGTDTLASSTTSSSSVGSLGRYSFNVTTQGDYLVRQSPATGFAQRAAQRTQAVNISAADLTTSTSIQTIDNFDTGAQNISVLTTNPITDSLSDASILRQERDLFAERLTGAGDFQVAVDQANSNLLRISTDGGTTGIARIIYDGNSDADKATADGSFSPVVDLTSGGTALGIRLNMRVDANGAQAVVRVRSASGLSTSSSVAIPNAANPQEVLFPFNSGTNAITGTADLTQATSIEIEITTNADADVDIDQVGTYGQTIETINLANVPEMTIGNLVFLDRDNNSLFDGSDTGIGGVDLQLFNDLGVIGTFEPGTDTAVTIGTSTATTSSSVGTLGQYTFTGLLPGNYIVVIPTSEFGVGQPLAGHVGSPGQVTTDTNNADHGGAIGANGVIAAVVLAAAGEPTNDGDSDANTNLTIDFGFVNTVLQLSKSDTPDPVIVGNNITYTLTATNNGPSNATNTVISDPLPTGLTFVSGSISVNGGAAQNVNNASNTITSNPFTLSAGQSAVMTIIATVGANFVSGSTNTGTVDSDETSPVTANASTTVTPNIDLAVTKTIVGGATTVGLGGTLTYRLTLTNNSTTTTVTGIEVNDDLPSNFTPGTLPSGVAAGVAPADLIWSVASLAPSASVSVDIPVTVSANASLGTATNTASIDIPGLVGFNDTVSSNNTATVNVTVEPRYDLLITKDDSATSVTTGQTYTYTLSVNNSGPSAATNVVVSDTLPASLEFISATSGGNPIGSANGQSYSATIASLASGATTTILLTVRVRPGATGTSIANTATVTADNPNQETTGRSNSATDTNTLNRVVTLNVNKVDSTDPVIAGGANFTYTITAFNSGSADAPNVLFSDPLPTGIEFVSGTFEVNETTPRTGTVTFNSTTNRLEANLGTLLAGGSASVNRALITLNVRAQATAAAGTVTNTATLTSPDNTTGVTESETTTINRNFDITVAKTDNADTIASGGSLVYTIVVTNSGPSTATNVGVSDTLPANLTFVSVTSTAGTFTNQGGTVSGTIPTLAQGTPVTVTITTTVNNNTPDNTVINNTATVTATGESNTNNNSSSATATVANVASLRGFVYVDSTRNNTRDSGEAGIPNVSVTISGVINGQTVTQTTTTNASGEYVFNNLAPGVYTVTQTQPANFTSAVSNPGSTGGTAGENQISSITLNGGANSLNNNFGEILVFSKRRFLSSST